MYWKFDYWGISGCIKVKLIYISGCILSRKDIYHLSITSPSSLPFSVWGCNEYCVVSVIAPLLPPPVMYLDVVGSHCEPQGLQNCRTEVSSHHPSLSSSGKNWLAWSTVTWVHIEPHCLLFSSSLSCSLTRTALTINWWWAPVSPPKF